MTALRSTPKTFETYYRLRADAGSAVQIPFNKQIAQSWLTFGPRGAVLGIQVAESGHLADGHFSHQKMYSIADDWMQKTSA